jgi:hypothetical protein
MTLGKFYPYCVRDICPLSDEFKLMVRDHVGAAVKLPYERLIARMRKNGAPDRLYPELARVKAVYDTPAAPKMTKEHKQEAVLRCLARLSRPPLPDLSSEREEFVQDGYRFYVHRSYLRGNAPLSERDVEYHIQASNLDFTKTKKEYHSWSCFVYMNVEGYFCAGQYPSLPGTMFGVQWGRSFNG